MRRGAHRRTPPPLFVQMKQDRDRITPRAPFWSVGLVVGIVCGVIWTQLWTLDEGYLVWGGFWFCIHCSSSIAACWSGRNEGTFFKAIRIAGYAFLGAGVGALIASMLIAATSGAGGEWQGVSFLFSAPIGAFMGLLIGGGIGIGLHESNRFKRIESILFGTGQAMFIGVFTGVLGIIGLTMLHRQAFTLSHLLEGLFLSVFFAPLLAIPVGITGGITSIVVYGFTWKTRGRFIPPASDKPSSLSQNNHREM